MCGRYVATTSSPALAAYFDVEEVVSEPEAPSFNVAPTDPIPAVAVGGDGRRRLGCFRWGLVPSWSPDSRSAARHINARSETVLEKPAFRTAFRRRRCLLPADGFYEWRRAEDGTRQPWFIHRVDGTPLAFAGLWDVWTRPDGERVRSAAILTTSANAIMAPVHDRMPVVLEPGHWADWLDPGQPDVVGLKALMVPAADGVLARYPVTTLVNDVRNNGPELLDRASEGPAPR